MTTINLIIKQPNKYYIIDLKMKCTESKQIWYCNTMRRNLFNSKTNLHGIKFHPETKQNTYEKAHKLR